MLSPAAVIPFLSHDDEEIRGRARQYLVSAHDPAPATADDFWAAADKRPPEEAGLYLDRLGLVPQTEASLRRLLDELPKADPATHDSLRRTLERVEFDLLRENWDTIRGTDPVPEPVRTHLQARLDLANEPAEPLWDRLMELSRSWEGRDITELDELDADRLIEAVSRHRDVFRDRVLAALSDASVKGWTELFVVDVAGEMKLADATPALLDKLASEGDGDLLWELAADALVHIGDEHVVRQIAERFPSATPGFQISAADVLGRIKRPESQTALVELLNSADDASKRTSILVGLLELIPDDEPTFATLRQIARDGAYDRMVTHLDEELIELSTITGLELPEGAEWRSEIERRRAEWSRGMSNVDAMFQRPGSLGPATLHAAPLRPGARNRSAATAVAEQPRPLAAKRPFRNAKPKVGRNDPCPCGSGKKFKKCCGK